MMNTAMSVLCALASAASALLVLRLFWRHRGHASRLALWTGVSCAWFAVSNALVMADRLVPRWGSLAVARAATACVAAGVLLFGLIWETE
jgi:hypothetical protein